MPMTTNITHTHTPLLVALLLLGQHTHMPLLTALFLLGHPTLHMQEVQNASYNYP